MTRLQKKKWLHGCEWTILEKDVRQEYVKARCSCGAVKIVYERNITSGKSKSCGHARRTQGGLSDSPEGRSWVAMKYRCYNPKHSYYMNYGGRGITVCERWLNSLPNFVEDMGRKPDPSYTIERLDSDGDYTPNNCVWATRKEQGSNIRSNRKIVVFGVELSVSEAARNYGLQPGTLFARLRQGLDPEQAVVKDLDQKQSQRARKRVTA